MAGFELMMIVAQILSVAIPRITDEFHRLNDIGWYASAYLLTTCGKSARDTSYTKPRIAIPLTTGGGGQPSNYYMASYMPSSAPNGSFSSPWVFSKWAL